MYVLFLKNDVAMSKAKRATINNVDVSPYDECIEVTKKVFDEIKLPAMLVNGEWVKTDEVPAMEYPKATENEEETPTGGISVYDELAAAYREGVQEA